MALISMREISVSFGGPLVLDRTNFQIERGERVCLLGRNGEGKSTLLSVVSGDVSPDIGDMIRQPGLRIGRLPQDVPQGIQGTVFDVVAGSDRAKGHEPKMPPPVAAEQRQQVAASVLTTLEILYVDGTIADLDLE